MQNVADIVTIRIVEEFNSAPGARNVDEGSWSGEEFLVQKLEPKFQEVLDTRNCILLIDLDDAEGYATSFLEEAFGGLARKYGVQKVLDHIDFKSDDEPLLKDEIISYIKEANSKSKK